MKTTQPAASKREDFSVPIKLRLSLLWVSVMLCYIYGDIFSLFVPGSIERLNGGQMGLGATTPAKLLLIAILMAIPALLVFLSLVLPPAINRGVNIFFGLFFTLILLLTMKDGLAPWRYFYFFLGVIEIAITSFIAWSAWKWPVRKE